MIADTMAKVKVFSARNHVLVFQGPCLYVIANNKFNYHSSAVKDRQKIAALLQIIIKAKVTTHIQLV